MLHKFTFGSFAENTYLLTAENGDTVIFDPGCIFPQEEIELAEYIEKNKLRVQKIVLTHAHIDHIAGNKFVKETYGVPIYAHSLSNQLIGQMPAIAALYGIPAKTSPEVDFMLNEGDILEVGEEKFRIFFVPGHSPDHLVFVNDTNKYIISGDVLFYESIGRTDLPGGNHPLLLQGIQEKLFTLPEDYIVYPGHGRATHIGHELRYNPFLM